MYLKRRSACERVKGSSDVQHKNSRRATEGEQMMSAGKHNGRTSEILKNNGRKSSGGTTEGQPQRKLNRRSTEAQQKGGNRGKEEQITEVKGKFNISIKYYIFM